MELKIRNVGKIDSADIEIKGITIIAGLNGTGKSTVSRSLFAIFCCCAQEERKIRGKRSQIFDEKETIVCAWDFFDFLLCSVSQPRLSSDFFSRSISTLKKSCH